MNATVAKAARRDLRRAVGLEAAGVLDAHSACLDQQVLPNLQAVQARLANVDERLRVIEGRADALRAALDLERTHRLQLADEQRGYVDGADRALGLRIGELRARGFWQRLRWLVTGA